MKFLEVFRFFFNDVVVFIYVFVDDNVYSNRIYVCIKEIEYYYIICKCFKYLRYLLNDVFFFWYLGGQI